jgi:hypothetical protein
LLVITHLVSGHFIFLKNSESRRLASNPQLTSPSNRDHSKIYFALEFFLNLEIYIRI